ncbi:DUF4097 domain-containing protein [Streptomyces piniterrae]|uniref:DUF4097 domain-containing protein n=1 Tax=Streptomyces piniterrae TaxID=2571125 RepID=A0A4U0MKT2_9ACTN|nr:DUF4097 family beta strand repeat-containing protein [Streptomyces piniterrae]TJZ41201.1 DUF4097 domain-containing protein [Streptomyces piniterrae]
MTTRKLVAENTGPLTIDASLLGHGGTITVHAEADCDRATLTIRTTDEDGPAAEAVREATLRASGTGLTASVQGKGGIGGGTTIVSHGNRGTTVIQSAGNITGSMIGFQGGVIGGDFVGGDVYINGVKVGGRGATVIQGSSPIDIIATVPEGSSLKGRSQSADIIAQGAVLNVTATTQSGDVHTGHVSRISADTQSGDVRVDQAAHVNAKTQSGDIRLGRTDVVDANTMSGDIQIADFGGTAQLKTMSGDVRVHATAGGDLTARTMSGDVDVTATEAAINDDLDVQANSMSGRVRTPRRSPASSAPRRRSF